MNKYKETIAAASLLFIFIIILIILFFTKKEDLVQEIVLINPEMGSHVIEISPNKKYVQVKIINSGIGTFTVSLGIQK